MNFPDAYDFRRYPIRGGAHPEAMAAHSWLLQGQHDAARAAMAKLTEPQKDFASAAATMFVWLASPPLPELPQRINTPCAECGRAGCCDRFHPAWLYGGH